MPYLILGLPRRKCEAFESRELPNSASFSIPPWLPGEALRLLSEVQEVFVFAYISQRQVFPERDPAGQADATCSSCLKKLALGCMLVFLESSSRWELPQAFRVLMVSSSMFAEPSANHSQIQNQHWSAPFNMLNLISI